MSRYRVWKYRGTVLTLSFLVFFTTFTLTYVKPMAQSMRTMREVYNFVYDEVNKRLMTTPWAGAQAVKYTETEILNFVYDPVNHLLKVSGGGGGTGTVDVSGTPTLDQVALWVDNDTLKGSSTLSMNVTSFDVSAAMLTAPNKTGTVLPATCTVLGQTFYKTDTFVTYTCTNTATNTWTPGGGGGVAVGDSPTWTGLHTYTPAAGLADAIKINTWVASGALGAAIDATAPTGASTNLAAMLRGNVTMTGATFTFQTGGADAQIIGASGDNLYISGGVSSGFRANGNFYVLIDTNNDSTTNFFRVANNNAAFGSATSLFQVNESGTFEHAAVLFANLGTPSNGAFAYCSDCTIASPCAGSGTGAFAKRLNGAWVCN